MLAWSSSVFLLCVFIYYTHQTSSFLSLDIFRDKDQARPQVLTYQWEWRGMHLSKLNNLLKWCSNLLQVDRVNVISVTEPHRHLLIMKSKNSLISNANRIAFLFSLTLFNICLMTMTPWKVRDLWICINWCWLVCFHFHLVFWVHSFTVMIFTLPSFHICCSSLLSFALYPAVP